MPSPPATSVCSVKSAEPPVVRNPVGAEAATRASLPVLPQVSLTFVRDISVVSWIVCGLVRETYANDVGVLGHF